ncbi:NfeD family protein [Phosphitispora sp. TUW77]|uniref:NfeD family protein n=1 Tax=Phosphitispora sp. TUW77 TaxID=3152361 RepID=UPI003AB1BC4C
MLELYWGCLAGGVFFALITVIFGDILGDAFDGVLDALSFDHLDFLQPMVIVGGITVFGGTGATLTMYTSLDSFPVAVISLLAAILLSIAVYFLYVKPMKKTENSTGFSIQDLVGKFGEVTVPVPAKGYGEVLVKIGAGNTNQIAASFDGEELPAGIRVVVAEAKDSVLYVFRYEEN